MNTPTVLDLACDAGERHFRDKGIAVEALARDTYTLWAPADCPMCRAGTPLE